MSEGTFTFYDSGVKEIVKNDLSSTDLTLVLLGTGYTPSASDSTWADIKSDEISDGDYSQQEITGATYTESSGTVTFDSSDISFGGNVSIEAKYAVIVLGKNGSLANSDALLGYEDLNTDSGTATVSSHNSTFAINTPSNIFTIS